MRLLMRILVAFVLLAAACSDSSQDTDEASPDTAASAEQGDVGQVKRAIVADRIDLAVIDPENMIGDAEECVVDAINAFLEGEVADLDADQLQWVYWVGEFAGDCGVSAGIVLDPLSGEAHLGDMGEGNIFGP